MPQGNKKEGEMKLILTSLFLVAFSVCSVSTAAHAQEPEVRRDANGVLHVAPVKVEGRRQRPVSVLVPRAGRVVGPMNAPSTSFVRRVVRSVRHDAF